MILFSLLFMWMNQSLRDGMDILHILFDQLSLAIECVYLAGDQRRSFLLVDDDDHFHNRYF